MMKFVIINRKKPVEDGSVFETIRIFRLTCFDCGIISSTSLKQPDGFGNLTDNKIYL